MASGDSKKEFLRQMILFVVNQGWSQTAKSTPSRSDIRARPKRMDAEIPSPAPPL